MSDEPRAASVGTRQSIVDRLTSRIGKISGLIGAIVVLATGIVKLNQIVFPSAATSDESPGAMVPVEALQCVTADMIVPSVPVTLSGFSNAEFRLTGTNDCDSKFAVHVAFKVVGTPSARFKTDCTSGAMPDPECWIRYTFGQGDIDLLLIPPELTVLGRPQTEPMAISVSWVIFTQDLKQVEAKIASISVLDDRPGA